MLTLSSSQRSPAPDFIYVVGEGSSNLTVLTLPHEIRLALTPAHFVLLEPTHGHPVGVRLAARGALHFECVVEGGVFRVEGAQGGDAVEFGF